MLTVKEAQSQINQFACSFGVEQVPIEKAIGRVIAIDEFADRDYPPFNRAAMDGYALRFEDFSSGVSSFEIVEEILAGVVASKKINKGECYKIMTGAPTPLDADCIIRVEDAVQTGRNVSFSIAPLKIGQNIAKQGEDKKSGEIVVKKNTFLRAIEIAALAVIGKTTLFVYKHPTISILSTGDEVISIHKSILPHQIRDSNSFALEAFLNAYTIPVITKKLVSDQKDKLTDAISDLIHSDILIISGGVSMGDADFVPEVLISLGVKRIFHKVEMKPGKPIWFGKSEKGVVFALPGNPMSVQVGYKVFIESFLRKCFGLPDILSLKLPMKVTRKKKVKFDEFFPCLIDSENYSGIKTIPFNGSGDVSSMVASNGFALQEANRQELSVGDQVVFYFW